MKIDNFALQMWQSCPAMYDLRIRKMWATRKKKGALGAGGALHLGLAEWHRTGELAPALLAINEGWPNNLPVDDFRTKEKVITTMIEYVKEYPKEPWNIVGMPDHPVIEVPFTVETGFYLPCAGPDCGLPTWQTDPDERQNPRCENCGESREVLEYGGIYDLLMEFSGNHYICDHKTTSVMGPSYFRQFKPNNQMTGYIWGGNKLVGHHDFSGASRMAVTGAYINAIGWKAKGKTDFKRDITSRTPQEITEWLGNVYIECCAIQRHEVLDEWPMRTGSCIGKFGACDFHPVHELGNPAERAVRLETEYVHDKWDYELREG